HRYEEFLNVRGGTQFDITPQNEHNEILSDSIQIDEEGVTNMQNNTSMETIQQSGDVEEVRLNNQDTVTQMPNTSTK
ncbi:hypothetical protein HAX54_013064, partial [Datura stramonium]|nr:hypothetical protein [Datura stramonium]